MPTTSTLDKSGFVEQDFTNEPILHEVTCGNVMSEITPIFSQALDAFADGVKHGHAMRLWKISRETKRHRKVLERSSKHWDGKYENAFPKLG